MKPILLALICLSSALRTFSPNTTSKYFQESPLHPHYDARYFTKPLAYDAKQTHLQALIQSYLLAMHEIGAETWLMHGTLLGWYWNRKIMPWDADLDVMVSEGALGRLTGTGKYLLEVNPHWQEEQVDQENMIDARWIDTETGLYIDITTLRRSEDSEEMVVNDGHHYLYDDIYPLRKSEFEGVPVKIPFAYADVLVDEYGSEALAAVKYESHGFDVESKMWVPAEVVLRGQKFEGG